MEFDWNAVLELIEIVILIILSILVLLLTKDVNQLKNKTEHIKYIKPEEKVSTKIGTSVSTPEKQLNDAQLKAERDRLEAEAEAEVQKIEADAKAYMVTVQAEAEAKANKEIAATISAQLIKYNLIHQWDGKLPLVSSDGSNIIDLRNVTEIED